MTERLPMFCLDCGVELAEGRQMRKCQPCHNVQVTKWRDDMGPLHATSEFPGVDIDAIHRTHRTKAPA